jgi:hypothetical protein
MKNLNKIKSQSQTINIILYNNKNGYIVGDNKIGFSHEYYFPEDKNFKINIYRYNHMPSYINYKLFKKYPRGVLKSEYKEWFKKHYK